MDGRSELIAVADGIGDDGCDGLFEIFSSSKTDGVLEISFT